MTIPIVRLKPKEERRILSGHLWVFSNEIAGIEGAPAVGDVVSVRKHGGVQIGYGFYNPQTLIAVRLFSKEYVEPDKLFFTSRITSALELRETLFHAPFYRLVHSESDFLPGLTIERFGTLFSVQILSAAMERRKDIIYDCLREMFDPAAIYERNEGSSRELEGLPPAREIVFGEERTVDYDENGVTFRINPLSGQKTGFYFDQRLNRIFSREFADHSSVLDLFSNEGGFALNLARAGSEKIVAVDSSQQAINNLLLNSELNGFKNVQGIVADVNSFLAKASASGEKYDVVVSDPPSFTKNRKSVPAAKAGYRHLHETIFSVLKKGGILLTASCSHHIFRETFEEVIATAAERAGRTLQLLHRAGASPDHPVLPGMPETEYLKFNVYRVF
ncbi:MAG: class I SAM-dependent rRNA methyltransferase [Bacteroidetes bacterium]|nr:class I SAM-dependent rRNA methyltransferase [Bacteroidota bacterium]MCL5267514.1 class I SAM-dependent rRNA methyltransferase [Bacteroidota bacterium]